jgi:hypothetical protein
MLTKQMRELERQADVIEQSKLHLTEEKLVSIERRLIALLNILPKEWQDKVEEEKFVMRKETGTKYKVQYLVETDKGTKPITIDDIWAWSDKDAMYVGSVLHIQPNMDRLQAEGKIRFYKIISKKVL